MFCLFCWQDVSWLLPVLLPWYCWKEEMASSCDEWVGYKHRCRIFIQFKLHDHSCHMWRVAVSTKLLWCNNTVQSNNTLGFCVCVFAFWRGPNRADLHKFERAIIKPGGSGSFNDLKEWMALADLTCTGAARISLPSSARTDMPWIDLAHVLIKIFTSTNCCSCVEINSHWMAGLELLSILCYDSKVQ